MHAFVLVIVLQMNPEIFGVVHIYQTSQQCQVNAKAVLDRAKADKEKIEGVRCLEVIVNGKGSM